MRIPSKIFVEVSITNREFIKVLKELGFKDESNDEFFKLLNDKYGSQVVLPVRPLDEFVQRIHISNYSYQLYMQGVIKDEENLVRKVLRNREKQKVMAK